MNIIIFGKNIEVKEGIKTQINDKFAKVGKYLDEDTNVDVTLSERKNMKKVEVTIPVRGHIIRAEEEDMDLFAAIDMAQDTLIRQLIRNKEKNDDKIINGNDEIVIKVDELSINDKMDEKAIQKEFLKANIWRI